MKDKTKTTLDWEKVAEENKRSFKAWKDYCSLSMYFNAPCDNIYGLINTEIFESQIGHLLTFFDERGVFILVEANEYFDQWDSLVAVKGAKRNPWFSKIHYSRPHALAAAFTEAFRVLEERIERGDAE